MPELPEVEVTRRGLADAIQGVSIEGVQLGKPLRWPLGIAEQRLLGQSVRSLRRRGKYLLMDLDEGLLLIHLGMSGSLRFAPQLPPRGAHDHFEMQTSRGVLRLHDPRRFGAVVWVEREDAGMGLKLLGNLGVEPLEDAFTFEGFWRGLQRSRVAIKQLLLSGKLVVGVGNIYASEVLFLAGISPTKPAKRVGRAAAQRLHAAIREVLAQAIAAGGSTLRDFSHVDGYAGAFQDQANVYDRAGEPCRRCGGTIAQIQQGQRSTYYCARCQK